MFFVGYRMIFIWILLLSVNVVIVNRNDSKIFPCDFSVINLIPSCATPKASLSSQQLNFLIRDILSIWNIIGGIGYAYLGYTVTS